MRLDFRYFSLSLLGALCLFAARSAAAPTVTYLFPAGGQRGTSVEVTLGGKFDRWPVRVWVGGKGVTAEAAKEKGKLRLTIAEDAEPGTYWLRVHDETGSSGLRPFIVGTLAEEREKEPNDTPTATKPLDPVRVVVNGRLEKAGDVDCVPVRLTKGQTLVAAVEAHRTLRSPVDAVLQVVSADGFVRAQAHDTRGLDPHLAFTAPADGTFAVRLFAFPSTPNSSIRFSGDETSVYRLTLTTGPYADHAWPPAVARAKPGSVELVGWNLPAAARQLTVPGGRAGDSLRLSHPQVANTVDVRLEEHACLDAADVIRQGKPLALPVTVAGRWPEPGLGHQFSIAATKGKAVVLRAESESLGFAATPVLTVKDAAGAVVARAEPAKLNADVELSVTPKGDGPLTVEVRDLFRAGGPRHAYCLSATHAEPDFALTVPSDQVGVTPGKPTELAVTVTRRNGMNGDVALTVEGLPGGVEVATVDPGKGKKAANAVTLRFTAKESFTPGPVRITGRIGKVERVASARLADFDTATEDLWLQPSAATPAPKKKKR